MNILAYNGCQIEQRPDGYVLGTQMAKANNVLIGHWLALESTKNYMQSLSIDIGIAISDLSIVVKGGDSTKQGTWLHPLLALNFGRWISPEFAIWCDRHIKTLIETGKTELGENPQDPTQKTLQIIDLIFEKVPIKPELVAGLKLNAAKELNPNLANVLEPSRQLLIASTAQEYTLLTPTEIGKRLGLSAIAVNKKLVELGLQVKNGNRKSQKDCAYLPTTKGSEFSDLTLATGSNNSTTYQQLRWYESILSVF